jgi:hypothetical protein
VIALEDRVSLAPGVLVEADAVVDSVRALRVPASPSAVLVLNHADGRTIAEVGEVLARNGAKDGNRDALDFCTELNRRLLVNVRIQPSSGLRRRAAAALRGLILHGPARRVRSLPLGLAASTCTLAVALVPPALLLRAWPLAAGVCAGVVLHEAAHAVALHGLPHALVLHGIRPTLVHPRLGDARALVVATAGPLVPALGAFAVVSVWNAAATACAPLAAHALGLTVLAPDGRNACGLS